MLWFFGGLLLAIGAALLFSDRHAASGAARQVNRLDRKATQYRASGALPPWD